MKDRTYGSSYVSDSMKMVAALAEIMAERDLSEAVVEYKRTEYTLTVKLKR